MTILVKKHTKIAAENRAYAIYMDSKTATKSRFQLVDAGNNNINKIMIYLRDG